MVLKPSPFTPLSTLKLGEILRDALPAGVLQRRLRATTSSAPGSAAHPAVRKISFTGSVATGKKVAAACAPDLKRVTLELGGNDAAIVLDDADVQKVAEKLFWGAFSNSGQICSAIKRLYVPEAAGAAARRGARSRGEVGEGGRRPPGRHAARPAQQQDAVRARERAGGGREEGAAARSSPAAHRCRAAATSSRRRW